jgi:hypothetical protein
VYSIVTPSRDDHHRFKNWKAGILMLSFPDIALPELAIPAPMLRSVDATQNLLGVFAGDVSRQKRSSRTDCVCEL